MGRIYVSNEQILKTLYDAYVRSVYPNPQLVYLHNTFTDGLLAPDGVQYDIGHIQSYAQQVGPGSGGVYQSADGAYYYNSASNSAPNPGNLYGSFLVRDTAMIATPIPAAIWLVGSALAGLVGFAGRKPT